MNDNQDYSGHGLRTLGEEIAFTAQPKSNSQSQILRYSQIIFCLPYRPKFSDFFDLCLHWVCVVCDSGKNNMLLRSQTLVNKKEVKQTEKSFSPIGCAINVKF